MAESLYKEMMRDEDAPRSLYSVTSLIEAQCAAAVLSRRFRGASLRIMGITMILSPSLFRMGCPGRFDRQSWILADAPARMVDTVFEAIPSDMRNANHHLSLIEAHARVVELMQPWTPYEAWRRLASAEESAGKRVLTPLPDRCSLALRRSRN